MTTIAASFLPLLLLLSQVHPVAGNAWEIITFDDFETGWGSFTRLSNAADATRVEGSIHCQDNGNCLRIRDDSDEYSSVFQQQAYTVFETYSSIRVTFDFKGNGMDNSEDFVLEYWDSSNTIWVVEKQYICNVDFVDNLDYQNQIVEI